MTNSEVVNLLMNSQYYKQGYNQGVSDVLGKIRAEIEKLEYLDIEDGSDGYDEYIERYEVLKIIDKYKTEK